MTKLLTILIFALAAHTSSMALSKIIDEKTEGRPIQIIKTTNVGTDKGSSIQATIDGHVLSIIFLDDLGQVSIEVSRVPSGETQMQSTPTPHGVDFYIFSTGSFIVTFTLANGDEYYGEFTITE